MRRGSSAWWSCARVALSLVLVQSRCSAQPGLPRIIFGPYDVIGVPTRQAATRSGRAGIRFLNAWSGTAALGRRRKSDAPAGRIAGHKSGAVANAARRRTVIGPEAFTRAIQLRQSRIAVTDRRIEGQQKDPGRILRFPREQS